MLISDNKIINDANVRIYDNKLNIIDAKVNIIELALKNNDCYYAKNYIN